MICASATARIPLYENDDLTVSIGGYTRAFTAWQKSAFSGTPAGLDLNYEVGLHANITRLELKLGVQEMFTFEVHNRLFWRISSAPLTTSVGGTGVGVSAAPTRTVDLSSVFLDEPTHRLDHDIDRLTARFFFEPVEISVGRQAITGGTSNLFPVADVWTSFSPFDLDTSQKRGVDGLRVVWGLTMDTELDFVVIDRGEWENLSGGVRATFYLADADVYVAAAKMWEELALFAGVSANFDTTKLRAEAVAIYDLDDEAVQLPRVTVGFDWFVTGTLQFSLEAHVNGAGRSDGNYLAALSSETVTRGEQYLGGRYYAGLSMAYQPYELLSLTYVLLVNAEHPSAMASWSASWSLAQDVDVSVGGFHGLGSPINLSNFPSVVIHDEFGAYGHQLYVQLSAFF